MTQTVAATGGSLMPWLAYAPLALLLALWLVARRRAARAEKGLARMTGPLALPLVGNAYQVINLKRSDFFAIADAEMQQYAPIYKTYNGSQVEVNISEATHAEVILRSSVNIEKGTNYEFLHPWLGTGLLTSKGQKWFSHRKLITPTFHFKILESFQEVFAERSLELVQMLEKEISNTNGFDVYPYITLCALDIICETAMGTQINAQRNKHSPYVDAIYHASELTISRVFRPWLHADFIYALTKDGRKYKECLNTLHSFTEKVIRERKEKLRKELENVEEEQDEIGRKQRKAFLDLLLKAASEGASISDRELREEVDTFMFEGHDTTSASLCWTLFLLGHHPEIQQQVYEEQKTIFGDTDRLPTMQDLSEMKYLEMVIKESLRLYPSVPFIMRTLTEEVTIGEHVIPEGVQVTLHIYRLHRNPKYFPEPDKFNPDNFLPEKAQGRHPFAYVPFSAGSRNCIGQKFAILEEKTILSTVLRHYRVTSLEEIDEVTLLGELVLRPENGIRLKIEKR